MKHVRALAGTTPGCKWTGDNLVGGIAARFSIEYTELPVKKSEMLRVNPAPHKFAYKS